MALLAPAVQAQEHCFTTCMSLSLIFATFCCPNCVVSPRHDDTVAVSLLRACLSCLGRPLHVSNMSIDRAWSGRQHPISTALHFHIHPSCVLPVSNIPCFWALLGLGSSSLHLS